MEILTNLFSERLATAVAWTVVHSLWQASLIALIMSLYLNRYKSENSIVRYRISLASLIMVFMIAAGTFLYYFLSFKNTFSDSQFIAEASAAVRLSAPGSMVSGEGFFLTIGMFLQQYQDLIALCWFAGAIVFSLKICGGYLYAETLKSGRDDLIPSELKVLFQKLKSKIRISRSVRLIEAPNVNTPLVVGFIKPAILFPVGVINQLEIHEVEAILAHELAHIARNDFLINLIQSFIENIFYYHPAVWWISANIRTERENCCDDIALRLCGNPLNYAKALVKIQEMNTHTIPSLAIPFAGKNRNLFNRICRILDQPQNRSQIREKLIATVMLCSIVFCFASGNRLIPADPPLSGFSKLELETKSLQPKHAQTYSLNVSQMDTIPGKSKKKEKVTIETRNNGENIEIHIEDGEVKEMKVNGKEVDKEDYDEYSGYYRKYIDRGNHGFHYLPFGNDSSFMFMDSLLHPEKWNHLHLFGDSLNQWLHGEKFAEQWKEISEQLQDQSSWREFMDQWKEGWEDSGLLDSLSGGLYKMHPFPDSFLFNFQYDFSDENFSGALKKLEDFQMIWPKDSSMYLFPGHDFRFDFDSLHIYPMENMKWDRWIEQWDLSQDELRDNFEKLHDWQFYYEGDGHMFFNRKVGDVILDNLKNDGLLTEGQDNTVELSGEQMKINGEKQSDSVWKKYKKLYEERSGLELNKGSRLEYKITADEVKQKRLKRI